MQCCATCCCCLQLHLLLLDREVADAHNARRPSAHAGAVFGKVGVGPGNKSVAWRPGLLATDREVPRGPAGSRRPARGVARGTARRHSSCSGTTAEA